MTSGPYPYSPECLEEAFSEVRMQDPGCAPLQNGERSPNLPDTALASRHLATSVDKYAKFC
jgi:hypothetical protein